MCIFLSLWFSDFDQSLFLLNNIAPCSPFIPLNNCNRKRSCKDKKKKIFFLFLTQVSPHLCRMTSTHQTSYLSPSHVPFPPTSPGSKSRPWASKEEAGTSPPRRTRASCLSLRRGFSRCLWGNRCAGRQEMWTRD